MQVGCDSQKYLVIDSCALELDRLEESLQINKIHVSTYMKDCSSFMKNILKMSIMLFYIIYSRLPSFCNPVGVLIFEDLVTVVKIISFVWCNFLLSLYLPPKFKQLLPEETCVVFFLFRFTLKYDFSLLKPDSV